MCVFKLVLRANFNLQLSHLFLFTYSSPFNSGTCTDFLQLLQTLADKLGSSYSFGKSVDLKRGNGKNLEVLKTDSAVDISAAELARFDFLVFASLISLSGVCLKKDY